MTFSGGLVIWLACCTAGLLTACGSLRYASLLLRAARLRDARDDVLDGTRHLWRTELERAIGWATFLLVGVLAAFESQAAQVVGQTPVGALIVWLLIGTVGLWSFKTTSDFLYARRRWRLVHIRAEGY